MDLIGVSMWIGMCSTILLNAGKNVSNCRGIIFKRRLVYAVSAFQSVQSVKE